LRPPRDTDSDSDRHRDHGILTEKGLVDLTVNATVNGDSIGRSKRGLKRSWANSSPRLSLLACYPWKLTVVLG
jgi:hypothetical protein